MSAKISKNVDLKLEATIKKGVSKKTGREYYQLELSFPEQKALGKKWLFLNDLEVAYLKQYYDID